MSEFKFSCPACGQRIAYDTAHAGTEITCPICQASIMVPKEAAGSGDASLREGMSPAWTGYNATTTEPTPSAQRTSGLAVASLICSLSSLVTCVGWLPGIICGHLAKSRIRRNPLLKGNGLATTGLAIGYAFLILEVGTAAVGVGRFSAAVKQGYEKARKELATNNVVITQTQSTTVSSNNQSAEATSPGTTDAGNSPDASADPEWTADISTAVFPDHPVSGKIHGLDFVLKTALFRNGNLKLSSADGMLLEIFRLKPPMGGQSYEVQSTDDTATLHVRMTWNENGTVQTATFSQGYGLKLQFDESAKRKIPAKIYLCFPDDSKSCVAGTFDLKAPKPK